MRGKRAKENKISKGKIILTIIIIIIVIIGIFILVKKSKEEEGNTNQSNEVYTNEINNNEVLAKPSIMAHINETNKNKQLINGETINNNISVYCNKGTIESITYNGSNFEGTDLSEEGTYVITMKPDDGSENTSVTITINKTIPTLTINGNKILEGESYDINSVITLKDKNGIEKITKVLLVRCNTNYAEDTTSEPKDITIELKNDGYIINERGIYKIKLLDENNNELEFTGKNVGFKVK